MKTGGRAARPDDETQLAAVAAMRAISRLRSAARPFSTLMTCTTACRELDDDEQLSGLTRRIWPGWSRPPESLTRTTVYPPLPSGPRSHPVGQACGGSGDGDQGS